MPALPEIGTLRAKVEVQTITMTPAAGGATTRTYVTVATLRGRVADVGGRSPLIAGVSLAEGTTVAVDVRAEYAVRKDHALLVDGARRLVVQRLQNLDDRGRFVRLWCEEERVA